MLEVCVKDRQVYYHKTYLSEEMALTVEKPMGPCM
jgi:hypothetical protein